MRYDDRTLTGLLLFFGSAQFLLVMLVCEGALTTYVVSSQAISDFGVGPTAALFNASIILLGLLILASAYFYHRTHGVIWVTVPFLLAGVGPIGVGLFPETFPLPHGVFAFVAFVFGGVTAILFATRVAPPFRYVSLALGLLGLVALGLFVAGQYAGIGFGGMERLIVYPVLFWGLALGGYFMSEAEPPSAPSTSGKTG